MAPLSVRSARWHAMESWKWTMEGGIITVMILRKVASFIAAFRECLPPFVQSIPKKELQGFRLSNNDIPSANQNGREAQHASAMDRNLVTLFFGIDCTCMQKKG